MKLFHRVLALAVLPFLSPLFPALRAQNAPVITLGGFATDANAFYVQPAAGTGPNAPCLDAKSAWTFYTFAGWQQTVGEDAQSVVQNPGFNNPAYPADDFSLPKGSPGVGFAVFDFSQAGRTNPVIKPPAVPATFPTKLFNPATDY